MNGSQFLYHIAMVDQVEYRAIERPRYTNGGSDAQPKF